MIDVRLLVKTWLLIDSLPQPDGSIKQNPLPPLLASLFQLGGTFPNNDPNRVYVAHLPQGFDPTFGPGVVVRIGSGTTAGTGGGSAHPEIPIIMPRMQITVFAGGQQYEIAAQVYRTIYDWIQRRTSIAIPDIGFIFSCLEQVEGQDVEDPHTHQATNISFWKLMVAE